MKLFYRIINIIKEIPQNNLILVLSLFIILIQTFIIFYTSISIPTFFELELLKIIYIAILIYFTIISILRLISKNPIFKPYLAIDIFSIIPSWILVIFFYDQFYETTGAIFLKGSIFLRLIPLIQILLEEKTFYLKDQYPIFFNRMISTISISSILFIFSGGILTSFLYNEYLKKEKENRINQIQNLIKTYELIEIPTKIPNWIIKIEQNQQGKLYEIYYINKNLLQDSLIPNIHFVYLQGKNPSEGLLISFLDLYKNKNYLELIYLITSYLMLGCLYFILRYYYKKYVFYPIEKINTVLELRLMGEDIQQTDLFYTKEKIPFDEIQILIQKIDELYHKLTEQDI